MILVCVVCIEGLKLKWDLPTAFVITTNTIFVENEENFKRTHLCVIFFSLSLFCSYEFLHTSLAIHTRICKSHPLTPLYTLQNTHLLQLPEFVDLVKIKCRKFHFAFEFEKSKNKQFSSRNHSTNMCEWVCKTFPENLFIVCG